MTLTPLLPLSASGFFAIRPGLPAPFSAHDLQLQLSVRNEAGHKRSCSTGSGVKARLSEKRRSAHLSHRTFCLSGLEQATHFCEAMDDSMDEGMHAEEGPRPLLPPRGLSSDDDGPASPLAKRHATDEGCDVCSEGPRKYCCPRCGIKTCSLQCCVQHKQATGCTVSGGSAGLAA